MKIGKNFFKLDRSTVFDKRRNTSDTNSNNSFLFERLIFRKTILSKIKINVFFQ